MRHPLHSICPYFAMFPESFVADQVEQYTNPGDVVFDPFCGRGTTLFESLLRDRDAIGVDVNPVAACISGAKVRPPELASVIRRVNELAEQFQSAKDFDVPTSEFFRHCFHHNTLQQLAFLRSTLRWKDSLVDQFIAAVTLGCLHGESSKSPNYLSNQMPRTISTKPAYSVRWWIQRGLEPPDRDAFSLLEHWIRFRLSAPVPGRRGIVIHGDARNASFEMRDTALAAKLIVTSPPYLDTTSYREDQWLRLWFLGGAERPESSCSGDDRYRTEEPYWRFLTEVWSGCAPLVSDGAAAVVRIGGRKLDTENMRENLWRSIAEGMNRPNVKSLNLGHQSQIVKRQTRAFRPGTDPARYEYDFMFSL